MTQAIANMHNYIIIMSLKLFKKLTEYLKYYKLF